MAYKKINDTCLTSIADAIREKNGTDSTYKPSEMAAAIIAIETGGGGGGDLPEEAFVLTGDCSYRFYNGHWDWFIENYGSKITTREISAPKYMFNGSKVETIPFELNFINVGSAWDVNLMFYNCINLKSIPKINNCVMGASDSLFAYCYNLRNLPEDIADWFIWTILDNSTSAYNGHRGSTFRNCGSLRSIPMDFLAHGNPIGAYNYSIYYFGFCSCFSLDEIVNLPFPHINATWTSNAFTNTFQYCHRLKRMTFATKDGAPYVVKWKKQTIDLTQDVGYGSDADILDYNSGITADKRVTDAASYEALKDDPDWYTTNIYYSRYNRYSAVETINSLPDASAYLATQTGSTNNNTIKFKGGAGGNIDGGAGGITQLTAEEVAVAAAKGWTVSVV